jgi:hypothetical protein
MLALISTTIRGNEGRPERLSRSAIRVALNHLYRGLIDWLFEPISFPGKWPE